MENNNPTPVTPQSVVQEVQPVSPTPVQTVNAPISAMPQPAQQSQGSGMGKKLLLVIVLILLLGGILGGGYYLLTLSSKPHTATVVQEPTSMVSPTPSVYQSNPSDATDQAITNDTGVASQSVTNVDSALNSADQGLNDKQTNLQ